MSTTRVWNITSDPNTEVPAQNLMVLGKLLKPGQSMQVDEALLKLAHKTKKDIEAGLLAVGKGAPGYLAKAAKATLPQGMARGHGSSQPASAPAPAPKVEVKKEEPKKEEGNKWSGKSKR